MTMRPHTHNLSGPSRSTCCGPDFLWLSLSNPLNYSKTFFSRDSYLFGIKFPSNKSLQVFLIFLGGCPRMGVHSLWKTSVRLNLFFLACWWLYLWMALQTTQRRTICILLSTVWKYFKAFWFLGCLNTPDADEEIESELHFSSCSTELFSNFPVG